MRDLSSPNELRCLTYSPPTRTLSVGVKHMGPYKEHTFTVLFEPAEEGGYVVTCPALPGLVTEGDTLEEAREMAGAAIRAYLESLRKDGLPIPRDITMNLDPVKEKIQVALQTK